jgi:glycosyltransferase involved in cell wall biosynthesis
MTSRNSVTILTEYFYPEEASTAQLLTELAEGLKGSFDISVVTTFPYYHQDDRSQTVPRRENYRDIEINRIRSTRFNKDVIPLRILNWLSFAVLVLVELFRRHKDDDVHIVLSNPPILPFVSWFHKQVWDTPYIYVIYDMYPDMPIELDVISEDGIIAHIWERAVRAVYRDADRLVVLGESMQDRLVEKMEDDSAFDAEKVEVIPNWEDEDFIEPQAKSDNEFAQEQNTVDQFTLLYSGNIGRYHELRTVVDAAYLLQQRDNLEFEFLIIGEGAQKSELQEYVDRKEIDGVRFLPFQPMDRLPDTLTCADASFVGIVPEMGGICVSSKLYSSLAAGQPVLACVAQSDEVARVVEENDCGAVVKQGDVERTAEILEKWAKEPELRAKLGENARRTLEENYTADHAIEAYRKVLREASGSTAGSA